MARSEAERKRIARQEKRRETMKLPDGSYPFLKEPFHEWLERTEAHGDWDSAIFHFNAAGLEPPTFEDDSGPKSITGEVELTRDDEYGYDPYAGYSGSIGRAEAVLDNMVAAVSCFALVLNHYKTEELKKRISELEAADLADPEEKKRAFDDIVKLRKMLERLETGKRIRTYEWSLKGF